MNQTTPPTPPMPHLRNNINKNSLLTHLDGQLVLQKLQIEVQVRLGHLFVTPAGKFGQNARGHVDNETILAIQQIQERSPYNFLVLGAVFMEYIHASTILLQEVINHHQNILYG